MHTKKYFKNPKDYHLRGNLNMRFNCCWELLCLVLDCISNPYDHFNEVNKFLDKGAINNNTLSLCSPIIIVSNKDGS
jgi:hypothetical protein